MPDDADFLCGGWIWDPVHRELRFHTRTRKGWKDEPEQVERPRAVASVTWHRWSQAPMQSATGDVIPPSHSRVVVAYEGGGDLTINEADRECAGKLAQAIAATYGVAVVEEGAPGGRRPGNLPARDEMGQLTRWQTLEDCLRYVRGGGAATVALHEDRAIPTASYADGAWLRRTFEVVEPG